MVLAGTFLAAVGGPAIEGLLAVGEVVPFVGPICQLLFKMKNFVDAFKDAGEESRRLSVDPIKILKKPCFVQPSTVDHDS